MFGIWGWRVLGLEVIIEAIDKVKVFVLLIGRSAQINRFLNRTGKNN